MNWNSSAASEAIVDLKTQLHQLQTREDFVNFVRTLLRDLATNPEHWENCTLVSYLEALAGWTEDMEGFYRNRGEAMPADLTWKSLGQMLLAARVYE